MVQRYWYVQFSERRMHELTALPFRFRYHPLKYLWYKHYHLELERNGNGPSSQALRHLFKQVRCLYRLMASGNLNLRTLPGRVHRW